MQPGWATNDRVNYTIFYPGIIVVDRLLYTWDPIVTLVGLNNNRIAMNDHCFCSVLLHVYVSPIYICRSAVASSFCCHVHREGDGV